MRRFLTLTDLVVPMHHPRLLAETAVRQGAELDALLKGSEVNPMMLSSPDARICYLQFGVIVSNALRLTGNPGLGMDLGRQVNPSNLGMLGVAVTNSPDVKTALEIGIKYSRLLAPAWDLTLGISGDRAICRKWEVTDCASCHSGTIDKNGNINTEDGLHINGNIDSETECYSCHGREGVNDAPPLALDGSDGTNNIGVGAHQIHLQDGGIARAIECEQCHVVPEEFDDPRHLPCERCHFIPGELDNVVNLPEEWNNPYAEVTFGEMAKTGNDEPTWDRDSAQCTNIYCHGASLSGGRHTEPIWTQVDGSQIGCDGCHGDPPPSPHVQGARFSDCSSCHFGTVERDGDINLSSALHIDGEVDVAIECHSCHGGQETNPAPSLSLDGSQETSR